MYNLLVSFSSEDWEGAPFIIGLERCVREYTDKTLTERFGALSESQVIEIRSLPCIFAYETGCDKDPKFGSIKDIALRKGMVRIEYEIIALEPFISYSQIGAWKFDLDIGDWEMNRSHWAIKDVDLAKELSRHGIFLPGRARLRRELVDIARHEFDVALSFPGETRHYVESVASELERVLGPNSFFYDNVYKSQLARPSLNNLLQDIYKNRSRLIVVFICAKYQEKDWCGIEFRAIQQIIMDRNYERIMFVRMDDGEVEGVFKTDGYIDGRIHQPKEVAQFIDERVKLLKQRT
jgi:hypothetical protein